MNFDLSDSLPEPSDPSRPPVITELQCERNWKLITDFVVNQQRQGDLVTTPFVRKKAKAKRKKEVTALKPAGEGKAGNEGKVGNQ
mmetsp:Transcript_12231/g.13963  ORF Transcript_12231/g.13963 Transcript_12231/m.13963 type:complete len:85 (+) Transcript_12231:145-399(+)